MRAVATAIARAIASAGTAAQVSRRACIVLAALLLVLTPPGRAAEPAAALPSFAELEAAGARIGEIRILNQEIFDLSDPEENKTLFRWANKLHVQTRRSVIEGALLFQSGDPLKTALIEETERVLRRARFLYDVQLRPVAWHDGVVDIEVATRDTWTFYPGISASLTGGDSSSGFSLREYNLLGTGIAVGLSYSSDVERDSTEFEIADDQAFDGWTSVRYANAQNSDGSRQAASIVRPFYALDTRWAAGVAVSQDDRLDAVYNAGEVISRYRHREDRAEAYGGVSRGRIDGWVQRYSAGVFHADNAYALEPGEVPPSRLPDDERLVGPFVRWQVVEDNFLRLRNRNQIERPEFFALGLNATATLGRASKTLGSTDNAWIYSGTVSRGFEPGAEQTLLASADIAGQLVDGRVQRQRLGANLQYYRPQSTRWLLYLSAEGDRLTSPAPADALLLGGDNGLRGYPSRYQSGNQRALFTVEERRYTDIFIYRLVRLGGAAYVDVGRAWGGDNVNKGDPGWLANVGLGLRLFVVPGTGTNVMHIDVAVPVNPVPGIDRAQLIVKMRSSF